MDGTKVPEAQSDGYWRERSSAVIDYVSIVYVMPAFSLTSLTVTFCQPKAATLADPEDPHAWPHWPNRIRTLGQQSSAEYPYYWASCYPLAGMPVGMSCWHHDTRLLHRAKGARITRLFLLLLLWSAFTAP
jgi:hypothetical protein